MSETYSSNRRNSGLIKTLALATGLAAADAAVTPEYASAQEAARVQAPNRIYSRDAGLSVAGDGALLKDYILDFVLTPESRINLDSIFYSRHGGVTYEFKNEREGLQSMLQYATRMNNEFPSVETESFRNYVAGLLETAEESDPASLNLLNNSVRNGFVDSEADSLWVEGQPAVVDGRYILIARSPTVIANDTLFVENGLPAITNIISGRVPVDTVTIYEPQVQEPQEARQEAEPGLPARVDTVTVRDTVPAYVEPQVEEDPRAEEIAAGIARHERHSKKQDLEFGVETGLGLNGGASMGAYLQVPLHDNLALEIFGNYLADVSSLGTDSRVLVRERELIGPATYKTRTDSTMTFMNEEAIADFGLGFTPMVNGIEFPLRAGVGIKKDSGYEEMTSTIVFERNQEVLETATASNTQDLDSFYSALFYGSAGMRMDLDKEGTVNVGGAAFLRGNEPGLEVKLGVRF